MENRVLLPPLVVRDLIAQSLQRSPAEYEAAENSLREAVEHPERTGFIPSVLSLLLNLRTETKRLKKIDKNYASIDSVQRGILVTCFGYTCYRNAKFGQIQVHERITETSRELLMQIKEMAENIGFEVLRSKHN